MEFRGTVRTTGEDSSNPDRMTAPPPPPPPTSPPVPVLYRVCLGEGGEVGGGGGGGAVIRSGLELSSPVVRTVPRNSIIKVVGRRYSRHPSDQCVERMRLAGGEGWVSARLNLARPDDVGVVELKGTDSGWRRYDAAVDGAATASAAAGEYHVRERRRVREASSASATASNPAPSLSLPPHEANHDDRGGDNAFVGVF